MSELSKYKIMSDKMMQSGLSYSVFEMELLLIIPSFSFPFCDYSKILMEFHISFGRRIRF